MQVTIFVEWNSLNYTVMTLIPHCYPCCVILRPIVLPFIPCAVDQVLRGSLEYFGGTQTITKLDQLDVVQLLQNI